MKTQKKQRVTSFPVVTGDWRIIFRTGHFERSIKWQYLQTL